MLKHTIYWIGVVLLSLPVSAISQEYFQQEVRYDISVKLDDERFELTGDESIVYINRSPSDLEVIYMHLWPNAYKNDSTALAKQLLDDGNLNFYYSSEAERGYIDQLDFKVDGQKVPWSYDTEHIDICALRLNQPLKSGDSITIFTPFHVKIPSGSISRLGHVKQSFQITQWYPKPAVYDRDGWHAMPYLNQGEFYSEFGSFDVKITVPDNYVVGATGDLQNEEELAWLEEKVKKTEAHGSFATSFGSKPDMTFPPSSSTFKTLHYKQSKVHDFAWFADKRYHVLKGEVVLPHSKRKVTTWAMFTESEGRLWEKSIEYINDATYYYSLWNGDYPYNHVTAVDGTISAGGGMEYPNITVIGSSGNPLTLETVIMHEVGHNWFYGILGSNERLHPWMDEGLNTFNEIRYIQTKYPDAALLGKNATNPITRFFDLDHYKSKWQHELTYLINARRNLDQPIEETSEEYTSLNYGGIVYSKTGLAFHYLKAYLGEETYDKAMQAYFEQWKFKHPTPADLKKVLESETGKNLDWFFDQMIDSPLKTDYKIIRRKKSKSSDSIDIVVANPGQTSGPISLSGILNDSVQQTTWSEGFTGRKTISLPIGDYDQYKLDAQLNIPELYRGNNTLKAKGLFRRAEPVRLQFMGSLENPNRSQLFFLPILGWNHTDKVMPGIALYNHFIPEQAFEYTLVPMYSISNREATGLGRVAYNFYPTETFQRVTAYVSGARFHNFRNAFGLGSFNRLSGGMSFDFKKKRARSKVDQSFVMRAINVQEKQVLDADGYADFGIYHESIELRNNLFFNLEYELTRSDLFQPYGLKLAAQAHEAFLKGSLEANYRIAYDRRKGLELRLFAGKFFSNQSNYFRYNWRMDGQSGPFDYTYDQTFLDRSGSSPQANTDPVFGQQFIDNHGGFKVPTANGQSDNWLVAINAKAAIPFPLPIGVFGDFGYSSAETPLYDAGLYVTIAPNIFEVYFPVFFSQEIQDEHEINGRNFAQTIRFKLMFNQLNPFNLARDIDL